MATRIGCGRICARCREAGGWGSLSPESHPVVQKKDDKGGAPGIPEKPHICQRKGYVGHLSAWPRLARRGRARTLSALILGWTHVPLCVFLKLLNARLWLRQHEEWALVRPPAFRAICLKKRPILAIVISDSHC